MMTWLSYFTRALSLLVILPLILNKFSEAEISLWYLFSSIMALFALLDFGFSATFIRVFSLCYFICVYFYCDISKPRTLCRAFQHAVFRGVSP